ncbi:Protein YIPF1 [Oryzias melastigma]|uniref:Protein YIPF n=1 Tax=Oryzias melastigma TaxID=30732 RepID=A0A834C408_ORYME|nr:Protein YIPF1 [Oryzias melastigma]
MTSPNDLKFEELEDAVQLLSADPAASTLSMSVSHAPSSPAGGPDVKVDLSEDEQAQEESAEVLERVRGSMMPFPGRSFLKHYVRTSPDLYGPFWICVTLVFSMAISGNLSTFLSQTGNPEYHYRPQFHRVTIAAAVIFIYAWLVPVALWGFLTWRRRAERQIGVFSFLETVCVYGYSLFIYIPTSVLWSIPVQWLQWILVLVSMGVSGSVLVLTFWPVVRDDTKVMAAATLATILVLHTLLAVGCKLYFFQASEKLAPSPTSKPIHASATTGFL